MMVRVAEPNRVTYTTVFGTTCFVPFADIRIVPILPDQSIDSVVHSPSRGTKRARTTLIGASRTITRQSSCGLSGHLLRKCSAA